MRKSTTTDNQACLYLPPIHRRGFRLGKSLLTLATIGFVAQTLGTTSAQQVFEQDVTHDKLRAVEPYNPYVIQYHNNTDDKVSGYAVATTEYDPEAHARALRHLRSGPNDNHDFEIDPREINTGPNNQFVKNISFEFGQNDNKISMLTITDAQNERFEVPDHIIERPGVNDVMRLEVAGFQLYYPFSFSFTDLRDPTNVFLHTNQSSFVFMDKYIQMDIQLPSQRMYGLGERNREFSLGEGTWTMWAKEPAAYISHYYDNGSGGKQGYGVHPFMLVQSKHAGDFFGIFFRNANAQSPLIKFNADGSSTLSYITTGGKLEIEFYFHGTAKMVISQYLSKIGRPSLPPFFALGWGQSSSSYENQTVVQDVLSKYESANLPLDTLYLDFPYMNKLQDFTVNKTAFPRLSALAYQLHDKRQSIVLLLEPGLQVDPESKYYKMAQDTNALIKSSINPNQNGGAVTQKSQDGKQDVFLDFFNPSSAQVWFQGLQDLDNQAEFDGLWLDLNEYTGFCNGECPQTPQQVVAKMLATKRNLIGEEVVEEEEPTTIPGHEWFYSFDQSKQSTWFLPFVPAYNVTGNFDNWGAISLNATHYNDETEYNLHNLNGFMQVETTYAFLAYNDTYNRTDNRPFILTRNTFPGSGRFASHWSGENWREWAALNYSIASIMNFNMFGIPHTGANVCGEYSIVGKLDQELCARWIQLAQFYPLARFHYNATTADNIPMANSEPYNLEGQWKTVATDSMFARYQYLRHMYTCLFEAHEYGNTCFDPLFFHYPNDENTFQNIEESFIVGSALKVSPILKNGVTTTYNSYFPEGKWVSLVDYKEVIEGGKVVSLSAKTSVNVHLRPGYLIPFQDNSDHSVKLANDLITLPIQIIVNRNADGRAVGSLFLDKGISNQEMIDDHFEYYEIVHQSKTLHKYLKGGSHATQNQYFDKLVILNAADLADTDFACFVTPHFDIINLTIAYDANLKTLNISNPKGETYKYSSFRQISYGNSKTDLNLCGDNTYSYTLKQGEIVNLNQSEAHFVVTHDAKILPDLNVTLRVYESNIVNVKWTFSQVPQGWRIPFEVPKEILDIKNTSRASSQLKDYVRVTTKPFGVEILGLKNNTVVKIHEMFLDNYLNFIGLTINTTKGDNFTGIFGLGERAMQNSIFYPDGIYNIWAQDQGMPVEDGRPNTKSLYGNHPFYMFKNAENSWGGVFHNLAANQDYIIINDKPSGTVNVTQAAAGGLADLFFFIDTTPTGVLAGYQQIVGKPVVVPQWALGWHQCRQGYKNTEQLYEVVNNYTLYNLPLDVQWSDIDYMYNYRDFTFDPNKFKNLHNFVDTLHHERNMHYVPIIDAGIAVRPWGHYPVFDEAVEKEVFIKINDGQVFIGQVWPNDAAFPDFFNPVTNNWWQTELDIFHDTLALDGLWLDMNEVANFCNGVCYPDQAVDNPVKHNLKYTPGNRDPENRAIALDAYHKNGYQEIDTHNLFGTMESIASHNWFQKNGNRTFTISRSSTAGHGKFASKWLGDNVATPSYMGQSVTGIMMQNMFGVPFAGSDICGFHGDTNPELCARWHAVGAFQPFSRNHNVNYARAQEPHHFKDEYYEQGISYMDIMRDAMRVKYSLIRYSYTQLMQMSLNGGSPVYKPMFFDYPNDINTFTTNPENNVLLGESLKLSILSNEIGKNSSDFYFPAGRWCNMLNYTEPCFTSTGQSKTLRTKAYDYYLHIKEGHIVPYQDAKELKANTTVDLQKQPIELHITGKSDLWSGTQWQSFGRYYNDDGYKLNLTGNNNQYTIHAAQTATSGTTKILVQVSTQQAFNYAPKDDSQCTAINGNDYVNKIRIYDATNVKAVNTFHVKVLYLNGTEVTTLGDAKVEKASGQLIFAPSKPLCLSAVTLITFTKLN